MCISSCRRWTVWGDEFFEQQVAKLEAKFSFGSKKVRQFTFTGVDITQNPDEHNYVTKQVCEQGSIASTLLGGSNSDTSIECCIEKVKPFCSKTWQIHVKTALTYSF